MCRRPIEPVFLAGLTDEALRIDAGSKSTVLAGVVVLRIDIGKTDLDRIELVTADTAIEDFAAALVGVERPCAVLAAPSAT